MQELRFNFTCICSYCLLLFVLGCSGHKLKSEKLLYATPSI